MNSVSSSPPSPPSSPNLAPHRPAEAAPAGTSVSSGASLIARLPLPGWCKSLYESFTGTQNPPSETLESSVHADNAHESRMVLEGFFSEGNTGTTSAISKMREDIALVQDRVRPHPSLYCKNGSSKSFKVPLKNPSSEGVSIEAREAFFSLSSCIRQINQGYSDESRVSCESQRAETTKAIADALKRIRSMRNDLFSHKQLRTQRSEIYMAAFNVWDRFPEEEKTSLLNESLELIKTDPKFLLVFGMEEPFHCAIFSPLMHKDTPIEIKSDFIDALANTEDGYFKRAALIWRWKISPTAENLEKAIESIQTCINLKQTTAEYLDLFFHAGTPQERQRIARAVGGNYEVLATNTYPFFYSSIADGKDTFLLFGLSMIGAYYLLHAGEKNTPPSFEIYKKVMRGLTRCRNSLADQCFRERIHDLFGKQNAEDRMLLTDVAFQASSLSAALASENTLNILCAGRDSSCRKQIQDDAWMTSRWLETRSPRDDMHPEFASMGERFIQHCRDARSKL